MRYIDVELIKKQLEKTSINAQTTFINTVLIGLLDNAPTADVVEVVRCKDCRYGEIDDPDFPSQYLCHHHGESWNDENHYCSYGKKVE